MIAPADYQTAEQAVISGALAGEQTGGESRVMDKLRHITPSMFRVADHRLAWKTALDCYESHGDAHPERVFRALSQIEGGASAIEAVVEASTRFHHSPASAVMFAPDLVECHRRTRLEDGLAAARDALTEGEDAKARELMRSALDSDGAGIAVSDPGHIGDFVQRVVRDATSPSAGSARIGWGIRRVDDKGAQMRPGDFAVLAARPGNGKTTFAVQTVVNLLRRESGAVLFVSLEMPAEQIAMKAVLNQAGVRDPSMPTVTLSEHEMGLISEAAGWIEAQPLFIPRHIPIKIDAFAKWLNGMILRVRPVLVVIDYLGLLSGDGQTAYEKMSDVSRKTRSIAKTTGVPFLAIHQMNRSAERDKNRPPQMSDLRDSGQLEQDATQVVFIHRDEQEDRTVLLFRKNRHGAKPVVRLRADFERHRMLPEEP